MKTHTVNMLGVQHRDREWTDREGYRWRFCAGGICNCWEREENNGWIRTERILPLADFAPFTREQDSPTSATPRSPKPPLTCAP